MSDGSVAAALRSDQALVLIEAPAGCGKTWQGATYAKDVVPTLGEGRLLILAHTHAACDVFAERTAGLGSRVEIRTIDALISQVAAAYHVALGVPAKLDSWAWKDDGKGFEILAKKVAAFLRNQPMVAAALARRYPLIICDEYQDCSFDQHAIVMALNRAGAKLRIFGDPLQRIYGKASDKAIAVDQARWGELKALAAVECLDFPHRWSDGCPKLGEWVLYARDCLQQNRPIDLNDKRPASVKVLRGDNMAPRVGGFRLSKEQGREVRQVLKANAQLMVLATSNDFVEGVRASWGREVPIWEGHTRKALSGLVNCLQGAARDPSVVAEGVIAFMGAIGAGFSNTTHGDLLKRDIETNCTLRASTAKRQRIQAIARLILEQPDHAGAGAALRAIDDLRTENAEGFGEINIDYWSEFRDATRLSDFPDPESAFAEMARRRSRARRLPPAKVLSSVHKAKGMECDNAMIMCGDSKKFSGTQYSKFRLYVALSRAKRSLTLVTPGADASPWLVLPRDFR